MKSKPKISFNSKDLVFFLLEKNLKIATAESCTGGLISKKITDIPGASNVFECGICSYSERIKEKVLGIKKETIEEFGVVSEAVAKQMAKSIRLLSNSDIAVSTTGFAGPKTSSSDDKVGLVYIGIDCEKFNKAIKLNFDHNCENARDYIRNAASDLAIDAAATIVKDWRS
ncbi:MAG: Nicotinamide-nucleotide amidohydrolase PncC [Eubacteriales bacterium SKADARSKE-1]|nr:Nicotinamide-nucleotide amidohydrolase PncC [Eubacteriales bacterium SKADARSKE-1]